jgi:hypothetical protein
VQFLVTWKKVRTNPQLSYLYLRVCYYWKAMHRINHPKMQYPSGYINPKSVGAFA